MTSSVKKKNIITWALAIVMMISLVAVPASVTAKEVKVTEDDPLDNTKSVYVELVGPEVLSTDPVQYSLKVINNSESTIKDWIVTISDVKKDDFNNGWEGVEYDEKNEQIIISAEEDGFPVNEIKSHKTAEGPGFIINPSAYDKNKIKLEYTKIEEDAPPKKVAKLISDETVIFEDQVIGYSSVTKEIFITNEGDVDAKIGDKSMGKGANSPFKLGELKGEIEKNKSERLIVSLKEGLAASEEAYTDTLHIDYSYKVDNIVKKDEINITFSVRIKKKEEQTGPSEPVIDPGKKDETPAPTEPTTEQPTTEATKKTFTPPVVGDTIVGASKSIYKVIKLSENGTGEVEFVSNKTNAKSITIPATVVVRGAKYKVASIAEGALKGNKNIVTLKIGNNVKTIGKNAFSGCTKLKHITIGESVTAIGESAFENCKSATKISVNTTKLKKVGTKAFKNTGAKKYKNLIVKVPKKKLVAYKKLFKKAGISAKAKVKN